VHHSSQPGYSISLSEAAGSSASWWSLFLRSSVLIVPEEGAHGKLPLAVEVAADGEAVLPEQAVDAPLGRMVS
jgi:hypothetical protein